MSQEANPVEKPEIVMVAAVRMDQAPNREKRRTQFFELGTAQMEEGAVRLYGNRTDGSLLFVMPDNQAYTVNPAIAANQCYQYWQKINALLLEQIDQQAAIIRQDEASKTNPSGLVDLNGNPI